MPPFTQMRRPRCISILVAVVVATTGMGAASALADLVPRKEKPAPYYCDFTQYYTNPDCNDAYRDSYNAGADAANSGSANAGNAATNAIGAAGAVANAAQGALNMAIQDGNAQSDSAINQAQGVIDGSSGPRSSIIQTTRGLDAFDVDPAVAGAPVPVDGTSVGSVPSGSVTPAAHPSGENVTTPSNTRAVISVPCTTSILLHSGRKERAESAYVVGCAKPLYACTFYNITSQWFNKLAGNAVTPERIHESATGRGFLRTANTSLGVKGGRYVVWNTDVRCKTPDGTFAYAHFTDNSLSGFGGQV